MKPWLQLFDRLALMDGQRPIDVAVLLFVEHRYNWFETQLVTFGFIRFSSLPQ